VKIYLAAIYSNGLDIGGTAYAKLTPNEQAQRVSITNILESYHYVSDQKRVNMMRKDGARVFLDSGAFSAFTKGVNIDLEGYCRYIHDNSDIVEMASVLDSIGDAQKTYENQCAMESLGTEPLPCFHYGEDERYLEYYVERYPYITIGGVAIASKQELIPWLDHIFEKYLTDDQGRPKVKTHGFAITSYDLMTRYPWYSVDSSLWVRVGSFGKILLPDFKEIPISPKHPTAKMRNMHFDTVPPIARDVLQKLILDRGYTLESLQNNFASRWIYNIHTMQDMANNLESKTGEFINKQQTLFQ
jgi:hypothetical protein